LPKPRRLRRPHVGQALQLSVMAGIRSDAIVQASGSARVVRAMPNTPALIGQGIAGLYARPEVDAAGTGEVQALFAPTGQSLWVAREDDLDAVTAISGSGPAYVFYFLEAMVQAATEMGLSAEQGRTLAQATFAGAAALASVAAVTGRCASRSRPRAAPRMRRSRRWMRRGSGKPL
jgi:pyrroline-5-carboxylate reductase